MSPYCLIAIAGLCFSNPNVKAEVANFGLGYTVTVTTRLANGRTLKSARTYRACTASR